MKQLYKISFVMTIMLSFISNSYSSNADSFEDGAVSYSTIVPLDKQAYLIEAGHVLLNTLINGEEVDYLNTPLFDDLDLSRFKSKLGYSRVARFGIISNSIRYFCSSSDKLYIAERRNHLTALVAIMWALTDLAHQRGTPFTRGAYTIVDPNHNIANFFLKYVQLVTGVEDPKKIHAATTHNNFAYCRRPEKHGSSHHLGHTSEGQFGIDCRFETWETLTKLLPHSKAHILFGELHMGQEEPLFFVKPEEVGLGSKSEFLAHSLNFLHSNKVEGEARREKDIDPALKASFETIRVLGNIEPQEETIREMLLSIQKIESPSSVLGSAIDIFHTVLEEKYPGEDHVLRTGNEVFLDFRLPF